MIPRMVLVGAILLAFLLPTARAQESVTNYIFMDVFVAREGRVLFYGETNIENESLDLGVGTFEITDGRFSNTTDDLTSKLGSRWNLSLRIDEEFAYAEINVYLPSGSKLVGSPNPSLYEISQEGGGLLVAFYGLEPGQELLVTYELGAPSLSFDIDDYLLPIGVVAVALIVSAVLLRFVLPRVRAPAVGPEASKIDPVKWEAIAPTLTDRERIVLQSVVKEGGRISQRKLRHVCDLPKSTLSRVTDELQRKGLLRKIPVGQTNEIRVDDRLLDSGPKSGGS